MSLVTPYKYDEYSLLDIQEWIKSKKHAIKFCKYNDIDQHYVEWKKSKGIDDWFVNRHSSDSLNIIGTDIYIDIPSVDKKNKIVFANIRFHNYPRTKYYEVSKTIYSQLKRKFGRKKDENWNHITHIKDWKKIQEYVREQKGEPKTKKWFGVFG